MDSSFSGLRIQEAPSGRKRWDGLITVDRKGMISDVNEQMSRMSGHSREELIGTPFADYFADSDFATAGVNKTFEKGVVTDYVLTLATRDGRQVRADQLFRGRPLASIGFMSQISSVCLPLWVGPSARAGKSSRRTSG